MKLVFLGPPGVGKGTYASRLAPVLGIPHISTGDLLREEVKAQTPLGKLIEERINKGILMRDEEITEVLKKRLARDDAQKGFILDGYPRTLNQARLLDGLVEIDLAVLFHLPEDIIIKKLAGRRVCKECGATYNVVAITGEVHLPALLPEKEGVCDHCGSPLEEREDDKEDVTGKRLAIYREQTVPVEDYYRKNGQLLEIPVTGSPDEMLPKIEKLLQQ